MIQPRLSRCAISLLLLLSASPAFAQDPGSPPPITLKADSHPSEVLAEFSKATGVNVTVWPENLWDQKRGQGNQFPSSISVDIQNQPFWVALDTILQEVKLSPTNMGQGDMITLQHHGDNRPPLGRGPQCVTTYATVVAYQLQRNHSLSLDNENPQVSRSCGMNINVYLDPRLHPIRYQQRPTIEQAVDENGADIAAHESGNSSDNDMNLNWMIQGQFIGLDYDPEKSKTLAMLKGAVVVQCAAETEKFEVEDLSKAQGTEKTVAGRKITITSFKMEQKRLEMQIAIERTDASKEEFRTTGSQIFRGVKYFTGAGKAVGSSGGGGGGGDDKLSYNLNASWNKDDEKPVKLVWEIPTRIEPVEIPFEFKDLPLP
jgi:hypothetical protein